jgi:hypothetical protein
MAQSIKEQAVNSVLPVFAALVMYGKGEDGSVFWEKGWVQE